MKIAMITPGLLPVPAVKGGAVEVLIQYLIDQNEYNSTVDIDLFAVADDKYDSFKYNNTKIVSVSPGLYTKLINKICNVLFKVLRIRKWRTSFGREVTGLIKKSQYDLIVVHNNPMAYRDIYEKTNNKNNLVYIAHNSLVDGDENHILLAQLIVNTAKKILSVSDFIKQEFSDLGRTENNDVLYNCINISNYKEQLSVEERNSLRKEYGIRPDDFVFIYSGRIDKFKGVLELVEAFKMVSERDVKLMIVGKSWFDSSEEKDDYSQKVLNKSLDVKGQIVFTGFIHPNIMPRMYQISDCLVVPSVWEEPFGVVALEGMASKLPLIVTNSGGLVEVVDKKCAEIVDRGDDLVYNLKTAMEIIVSNKERSIKMGEEGYLKIMTCKEYDKDNYYENFCKKLSIK